MRTLLGMVLCFGLVSGEGSAEEKWISLFDGKTLKGWTTDKGKKITRGWKVTAKGELHRESRGGHIVSEQAFETFELTLEWKIAPGGNSGIKYRLVPFRNTLWGLEYQIFDDFKRSKEPKPGKGSCGALYNLYPPKADRPLKQAGEWNRTKIVVDGSRIEHWLNGKKIVDARTDSPDWKQRLSKSKYRPVKGFAPQKPTKILLQDHGSKVWFRKILIRPLTSN